MTWTWPRKIAAAVLVLLLVAAAAAWYMARQFLFDRYAGDPQVVGLPPGYDPRAISQPYTGPHPSMLDRAADPYRYPVPIGAPGPVKPNYAHDPEYPFACRSEPAGLGQPLVDNQFGAGTVVYFVDGDGNKTGEVAGYSKDCSLAARVYYLYRSRESGDFLPYGEHASDAEMLDIDGREMPFVVRVEIGTINRHIYVIALLRGPDDSPESPDLAHWNGRLIYQFRGGSGIGRRQGRIQADYIPERRHEELRRGYAIAYSTGNQTSNSYDFQLAEDTLARVKRQFAARYGEPRSTIGIGASGGAIQQYLIAEHRPGLLDAGIALYSYPDMVTQTIKVMDCELLEYFFDVTDADNPKWKTWSQRSWIEGFNARDGLANPYQRLRALQALRLGRWPDWSRGQTECTQSWRTLTPQIVNPNYTYFGSLFAPGIVRQVPWTYWDNLKRFYGTDENGLALQTYDNVGVQYGLEALRRGRITMAEFLKLNAAVGGWKPPGEMLPERFWQFSGGRSSLADLSIWSRQNMYRQDGDGRPARRSRGNPRAIAAAYRSGQVYLGITSMPVIDLRHYLEPELNMHHSMQSFSARLRMLRQQGHADHQLVWFSRPPHMPLREAFDLLERWLEARRADPSLSLAAAKPEDGDDRCYRDDGGIIARGEGVWDGAWNGRENGACMSVYPIYSNPRIVAGDDYAGWVFKCHLQTVDAAIAGGVYAPLDVAAYRQELERVFPDGVCDYSRGDAARPDDLLLPTPSR